MTETTKPGKIDWLILLPVAALLMFSVAFVYSASSTFAAVKYGSSEQMFWNHAIRVLAGIVTMIGVSKIDYRFWYRNATILLLISIGFLFLVLLTGAEIKGASRWIHLGPLNFQPSELAKYALVMQVAVLLSKNNLRTEHWRNSLAPVVLWTLPVCLLIGMQPNMSTMAVILLIVMVMMFLANIKPLHLMVLAGVLVVGMGVFAVSADYRIRRLQSYLGTESADEAVGYQLDQALIAFGNGGITGVGPGQSRQRDWFLPESYGDFIFSIVGEEYGYIGVVLLLLCFIVITWRGFTTVREAPDTFGRLLAGGITTTLALYAFVNAGVTCGLLPTTGLPMPFISYGGSSVLFSTIAVGILLNISSHAGVYGRKQKTLENT
ncbi:MAG: putative lipid II flippase FtsW [Flavobacteriales bacterium]|nr:MAG: putative lipid II flippase FtsW [Bacteroidota bacterium]KXK35667.1 MAG: cell division membrane protein FtsW [Chlorobi bacterium OLB6]MBE2266370.1 putative lipid II flippase FtsW [Flavobacteriales bacterium]MBV6463790.1 putative peptidoglycan glycosyltransferase FtsW [Chlorobiota bacterium]MBW7853661.1 putative lipid II flippase FtsW [Candidatus Kapabacteria bacterium]MCC6332105.1 putative lipid II flippase FtsW [Ignavibacteria bacterium]